VQAKSEGRGRGAIFMVSLPVLPTMAGTAGAGPASVPEIDA
jgi:hypothetical protein